MRTGKLLGLAFLLSLPMATPAFAASLPSLPVPEPDLHFKVEPDLHYSIAFGLGALGYVSGGAGGAALAWDFRLGYTLARYVTFEVGYTGAAGDAFGIRSFLATMIESDVRVNFLPRNRLSPYFFAGAGWGRFVNPRISGGGKGAVTVPLGVGLELRLTRHLSLDTRVLFRFVGSDRAGPLPDENSAPSAFGQRLFSGSADNVEIVSGLVVHF